VRKDRVFIGMKVLTKTTSGEPMVCTVLGEEHGEFVLSSESHGYAIRRGHREIQPVE
jgi:hypothetical protein